MQEMHISQPSVLSCCTCLFNIKKSVASGDAGVYYRDGWSMIPGKKIQTGDTKASEEAN